MAKKHTVYMLRCRMDDASPWGPPEAYATRKERDSVARINRCLGGIRTHSYEETMATDAEVEALLA